MPRFKRSNIKGFENQIFTTKANLEEDSFFEIN